LDLPTGATIICLFGVTLLVIATLIGTYGRLRRQRSPS
jgi:hypothetical protein